MLECLLLDNRIIRSWASIAGHHNLLIPTWQFDKKWGEWQMHSEELSEIAASKTTLTNVMQKRDEEC